MTSVLPRPVPTLRLLTIPRLEEPTGKKWAKWTEANKAFFEAVKTGDIDLGQNRAKIYQRVMVGSEGGMDKKALKAGKSMDEMQSFADRLWSSVCVAENWDRLMERGVDILFQPGTNDYVAYDILWGAQNYPRGACLLSKPMAGTHQTPHGATAKDEQNRDAFLWNHFFGGESVAEALRGRAIKSTEDNLSVSVSFNEGPQPTSGRIWWTYDRAPAGSAPFLHVQIPEDQWMDMERDAKTGSHGLQASLCRKALLVSIFSATMGKEVNGYQQYLFKPLHPGGTFCGGVSEDSEETGSGALHECASATALRKATDANTQSFSRSVFDMKDGKLNTEEIQQFVKFRQRNMLLAAERHRPTQAGYSKTY